MESCFAPSHSTPTKGLENGPQAPAPVSHRSHRPDDDVTLTQRKKTEDQGRKKNQKPGDRLVTLGVR